MRRTRSSTRRKRNVGDTVSLAVLILVVGGAAGAVGFVQLERAKQRAAEQRSADLKCLAENVYYEARGEPLVGQYAVAEVTMNRVRSPLFPSRVCDVVYARGAFSWTRLGSLEAPYGYEWRRAQAVASTIYDNPEAPLVDGALFYHATYVSPTWAQSKARVVRIGRHLFYL